MSASKWARKSHGGSDDLKRWGSIKNEIAFYLFIYLFIYF
jgi:hypothetical protein